MLDIRDPTSQSRRRASGNSGAIPTGITPARPRSELGASRQHPSPQPRRRPAPGA